MAQWHIVVYCPAYNVESSIGELVERAAGARKQLSAAGASLDVMIIVNDGSSDTTAHALQSSVRFHPFLRIITKKKNEGATAAVIDGMKSAAAFIRKKKLPLRNTIIVRMDSDLEHQPEDLLKLLSPISSGKSMLSVGYIPFDARSGAAIRDFNRKIGLEESRRFLGAAVPQFCPGFNAIRGDLFARLAPVLAKKAASFRRATGKPMLTIDIISLATAKKMGAAPSVVRLRKIQGKWLKKPDPKKIASYLEYHKLTMEFLSSRQQ